MNVSKLLLECPGCNVQKLVVLALYHVALYCTCFARRMVKVKRTLRVYVVVPSVAQRVVLANQDLGAAAWELCRGELLLVVLLESG